MIPKVMRNEDLSINKCVDLFGNLLKRMFTTTLIKRHMLAHYGKSLYASRSCNNKLSLLKKMMALKYKEGTSTADHVRRRSQGSTPQYKVLVTENMGETEIKMERKENKGGGDKHNRKDDEQSEYVVTLNYNDLLVICDEKLINLVCDETSWVIGTGASLHVTSKRDFFISHTPGGRWVMTIWFRLLAWEMLACKEKWKLTKDSLVVARGKKSSNLYLMTPPKTPQLNCLAERMNWTLIERVRCLLSDVKLPRSFLAEALNTVTHVINLSPSVPFQARYDFDVPMDDDVNDQQQETIAPPAIPPRRSFSDRRSSVRYSSDEYVLLTDGLRALHGAASWICCTRKKGLCVQIEEELVWFEASSKTMIQEV
ncbi:hypothetical protein F3Y22_tig00004677pilonHSYRG00003 [Hibiscus syriacus]|uniref:Integrase catalytic domain-containing protein n=1 Tax=Hibiscus syriacus TaxID=106335 RepID=A0A6A3CIA7_HIBSY|nr:hypothetical protein F3Y22_tig00004677pilonHSYRG00003 [Hibiscus syriacus]